MKNRHHSEESKRKISEAKTGRKRTDDEKEKIRLGLIKRYAENRAKLEKLKQLEAMLKG